MYKELLYISKHSDHSGIQNINIVIFPPGKQSVGSEHIEAPSQSCAVSQLEWLLLAGWLYSGASCLLQESNTP